ncbi:MAG: hypothetical protein HN660_06380, partial [Flavobacteriaceae bacterium]|nr:hypothetical protein [Flavobacteriaceae bacterium]
MYDLNDFTVPQSSNDYLKTIPKPAAISVRANKVPVNLGRQIDNVKPWFEPKRIIPRSKSK